MKKTIEEVIELVDGIKPLPFLNQQEKNAFQLALDLVKAALEESEL